MTVMFTDIVGFTTMAEGRSATEVADMFYEHFQILGACVEEYGGTIDKYIGDALMAFWGAPEEMDETSTPACYCAMAMVDALERDNHRCRRAGQLHDHRRHGEHLSADREFGPRDRQFKGRDENVEAYRLMT